MWHNIVLAVMQNLVYQNFSTSLPFHSLCHVTNVASYDVDHVHYVGNTARHLGSATRQVGNVHNLNFDF